MTEMIRNNNAPEEKILSLQVTEKELQEIIYLLMYDEQKNNGLLVDKLHNQMVQQGGSMAH